MQERRAAAVAQANSRSIVRYGLKRAQDIVARQTSKDEMVLTSKQTTKLRQIIRLLTRMTDQIPLITAEFCTSAVSQLENFFCAAVGMNLIADAMDQDSGVVACAFLRREMAIRANDVDRREQPGFLKMRKSFTRAWPGLYHGTAIQESACHRIIASVIGSVDMRPTDYKRPPSRNESSVSASVAGSVAGETSADDADVNSPASKPASAASAQDDQRFF
jgi:hypothetical protein